MPKEIIDMMIKEVSAVDRAATKKKFLLIKKDDGDDFHKRTLDEVLANQEAHSEFMKSIDAFYNSVHSTMRDSDLSSVEKAEQIKTSSNQLVEKLNNLAPDLAKRMNVEKMTKNAMERIPDEGGENMPELKDILEKIDDKEVRASVESFVKSVMKDNSDEGEETKIDKSAMPEELKKRFEDLEKKAEMAEQMAKAEREKRLDVEFNKRAKEYSNVADVEKIVSILKHTSEDEGLQTEIEEVLKSAQERLAKADLFKEVGGNGGSVNGAEETIEKKTKELMKSDTSLTYAKAQSRVLKENPDLYNEYVNQK